VLRGILLVAGLAVAVAFAVGSRPGVFSIALPAALLLWIVGAGLVVSDAIPLRPWALAASLTAMAAFPVLVLRPTSLLGVAVGAVVAVLQAAAFRRPGPRGAAAATAARSTP
jgi:hypothetical protein